MGSSVDAFGGPIVWFMYVVVVFLIEVECEEMHNVEKPLR